MERGREREKGSANVIQRKRQCIPVLFGSLRVSKTGTDGGKRGLSPIAKHTGRKRNPLPSDHTRGEQTGMGGGVYRQDNTNGDEWRQNKRTGALGKETVQKLEWTSHPVCFFKTEGTWWWQAGKVCVKVKWDWGKERLTRVWDGSWLFPFLSKPDVFWARVGDREKERRRETEVDTEPEIETNGGRDRKSFFFLASVSHMVCTFHLEGSSSVGVCVC